MSESHQSRSSANVSFHALFRLVFENRLAIVCIFAAAVVLLAAFACTTIRTRDSLFSPLMLQILVAMLSSLAGSLLLVAKGVHHEVWHLRAWALIGTAWFSVILLT